VLSKLLLKWCFDFLQILFPKKYNGQLKDISNYVDDKLPGEYTIYYKTGNLYMNGKQTEYCQSGGVYMITHYNDVELL
jgi:antitoxin component YwqK of YwqJK toxin-antitoxin module